MPLPRRDGRPPAAVEAERRLTLIAAGTAARRERLGDEARRCAAAVDWEQLAATLTRRRLLPLLGPRIAALSGDLAAGHFRVTVERSLEVGRRQAALLQLVSMRASAMLAKAGIRTAQLKGPALGEALYGDPSRRFSSDIDLLVPVEQLDEAVAVVRQLGYGPPGDPLGDDGLPQLHLALEHERGELPPIELHWRIHRYEREFARERLLPETVDAAGGWRPEPAAELASLLLYYARDGLIDLRYPADLAAWWDSCGEATRPGELAQVIAVYPALARPLRAAAMAAGRLTGLPARRLLGEAAGSSVRLRLAISMANPNPRSKPAQLYADCGLLEGLLSPPGTLGSWMRRQLLPPNSVRAQQARHGRRSNARSSAARCLGVLARYGYRLATLPLSVRRRQDHLGASGR